MGFIWYIIIGIIAGFLAGKIMRGGGFGLIHCGYPRIGNPSFA